LAMCLSVAGKMICAPRAGDEHPRRFPGWNTMLCGRGNERVGSGATHVTFDGVVVRRGQHGVDAVLGVLEVPLEGRARRQHCGQHVFIEGAPLNRQDSAPFLAFEASHYRNRLQERRPAQRFAGGHGFRAMLRIAIPGAHAPSEHALELEAIEGGERLFHPIGVGGSVSGEIAPLAPTSAALIPAVLRRLDGCCARLSSQAS